MKRISELVLYKDHHIIVFNKPSGLATQPDKTGDANAHQMAMAYARRDLYIVHRLDRRVSGVLLFAKTKPAAAFLSSHWHDEDTQKKYLAIVPTADIPVSGEVKHYLTYDNKSNISTAHEEPVKGADESIMSYTIKQQLENFMVLDITLLTGRKHQIRAQLAAMGIPVRGDIKYGSKRTNTDASIDLHAYSLQFVHPSTKKVMTLVAPLPEEGLWKILDFRF